MFFQVRAPASFLVFLVATMGLQAQDKPGTDVIVFVDGERLIGELKGATGKQVHFHSDMGFDVHVGWAKIKELRSSKRFAAIPKDLIVRKAEDASKVPQGTVELAATAGPAQNLEVRKALTSPPQTVPVNEVSTLVGEPSFEASMKPQSFWHGWKGGGTVGASIQSATVSSRSVFTSFDMSRSDHPEGWREMRNRTSIGFNSFYSLTTQAYSDPSKVSMFHAEAVQDHFFKPRFFAFVGTTFDHNYSQGLDLVQAYGGGLGGEVIKTDRTSFEVRGGIGFMNQTYSSDPSLNRKLVGSRFGQSFSHTFKNGISFFEQGGVRPAWNDMKYFFAGANMTLRVPVYRGFSLNIAGFDNYVNNPPPYFKRNAAQVTMGINYSFR